MAMLLPAKDSITGNVTQGQYKTAMNQLVDFVGENIPPDGTGLKAKLISNEPAGNVKATDVQTAISDLDKRVGLGQGYRNKIINGDMVIDQRNSGAAQNGLNGAGTYLVDRWVYYGTQSGKFSAQQNAGTITPPPGFNNYLGLTVVSAYSVTTNDAIALVQSIEGLNCRDLGWGTMNAQAVTLSFWLYSNQSGPFSGSIRNNGNNRSYPFVYTVPAANVWTRITVTIPGDIQGIYAVNNTTYMSINFNLGSGSTYSGTAGSWAGTNYIGATGSVSLVGTAGVTFYITGVQLEKGAVATSFEVRDYGDVLRQCQRYYQLFVAGGSASVTAGQSYYFPVQLPVPMRTTPTCSWVQAINDSSFPVVAPSYIMTNNYCGEVYKIANATAATATSIDISAANAEL
jgi:hypothetical protein